MRPPAHATLLHAALVAVPFGAVLATRSILGVGPAAAPAAPSAPPLVRPVASAALTPAEQRAAAWLASLPPVARTSPMDHPAAEEPAPEIEPEAAPEPVQRPALHLSMVVGAPGGGIAMINGVRCRAGDQPTPGCTITAIDARRGTVEVTFDDGATLTLHQGR